MLLGHHDVIDLGSELAASFWGAGIAFGVDLLVTVVVSLVTKPKPEEELRGLVWGLERREAADPPGEGDDKWWRSPALLGAGALGLVVVLNVVFI